MRPSGRAGSRRSRVARGHVCCPHDHPAEYRQGVVAFFTEGLRNGLRVAYAGSGGPEQARADLAEMGDLDRLLDTGALHILSLRDVYGPGGPVDAEGVAATYAAATERALADGFRGLRVSANASELLRTPQQQDAFARYEFLVGRYTAAHPLSALCGFGTDVAPAILTEFASLHDAVPTGEPVFRVFGCPDDAVGLAGQFDPVSVAALGRVLARLRPGADAGALVVDLADVEYVDHRLLLALSEYGRTNGVRVSVRRIPSFAARLIDLLPASYLRLAEVEAEP